jgi:predicted double-glycine peptidase
LLDMKLFVESRGFKGAGFKGLTFERLLDLQTPIVPIDYYGNAHFVCGARSERRGSTAPRRSGLRSCGFGRGL